MIDVRNYKNSAAPAPSIAIAIAITLFAALASNTAMANSPEELVWCHDVSRSIVIEKARWRCKGNVVDADEAERIKDERARRIRRVLNRAKAPLVPNKRLAGTGTGFFISGAGQVVTNHHVVEGCEALSVIPVGGEEVLAPLAAAEPRSDLALLHTTLDIAAPATLRQATPISGESVTIVGYPLHGRVMIKPKLVTGTVDSVNPGRSVGVFTMKVDVRRGNSGGPILDSHGRVIGIVVAKIDTPSVFAKTGQLVKNVGIGIRPEVYRQFLTRNGVKSVNEDSAPKLDQSQRFARARQFVAQIRCWTRSGRRPNAKMKK
jgi:S1-C subfamily serine protease